MSQVNHAVSRLERRELQRAIAAAAVTVGIIAVGAFQLRQEAARSSVAAPPGVAAPAAPAR
ncbi:MAG: hypothetical protein AVDCRST_MAG11-698 [uncultured Gemmatimonadaceae bacterium]|uniref:Uncharacterized protein n=2 Tax=Bacteria TaxID=2 RepID=A0A6J4K9S1_9BACT|nr:MAG: hypothetical protein AVDCRST_MAG11-698 [uncultured Gemmatimonadaceae bacterium]CAA9464786.1 MAG: hypothetical protein AVDCRST_MAG38-614 [uncultured Solirubrobacteraceae bacterium]